MIEFIKNGLENLTSNASWIDETARMSLIKTARKMKFLSGYNPKVRDIQYVNEYYKFIPKLTNDSNLNVLYISFIRNFIRFSRMNALVNRTSWPDYSITNVRIYKEENENVIVIPACMLQNPLFETDVPRYMNYASLGILISREIILALFEKGSTRDKNGVLRDWWTNKSKEQFRMKLRCFMKYNSLNIAVEKEEIIPKELHKMTIVDNMAITLAYRAYQIWEERNGKEKILPRLDNFTILQLFFLSYTNLWCDAVDRSLERYSVNLSFNNMEEFSEVFNCTEGPVKNQSGKCNLWK
ncbi:endothelin-converting enzyme homolog isoform X1 [Centruroides sculpturatus]|uniref:endothelin-converting enzyme homolog isoform X1 n=1 Tax=Centruroides sculpturatus TaxID=218467 RepID=UPI000C6EF947|nr:endothelin-converting enzyme homolog isoform X1 [Centruroides sculpturatus]